MFIYLTLDLDLLNVANALKWAFLVLPNYCLGQGLTDIFDNYNALDFFNKALDMCLHIKLSSFHPTKAKCEKLIRKYGGSQLEFQENYLSWDNPGIGRYLVFLALEGIVFYSLVLLIEYGVFNRFTGILRRSFPTVGVRSEESSVADDDDVLVEKRRVMSSENMDDVLAIKELTKVFSGNGREYNSRVLYCTYVLSRHDLVTGIDKIDVVVYSCDDLVPRSPRVVKDELKEFLILSLLYLISARQ